MITFTKDVKFMQKAILFHPTEKDKFLALKRADNDPSRPGDWDFPGGNVEYKEEHMHSLIREIDEEVSLTAGNLKPAHVYTHYIHEKDVYVIFLGYTGIADHTNVTLSHEHIEYRWVTKDEFLQLVKADFLKKFVTTVYDN